MVTTDFYIVHFSAFQPPDKNPGEFSARERETAFQPYCHELPHTGTTYFGFDFIDRDARSLPIALSVIEEMPRAEDNGKSVRTLEEVPAKVYSHGVAELKVDFDYPGRYAVLIQFGGKSALEDDRLRIPLSVGMTTYDFPVLATLAGAGGVLFFALFAYLVLTFWRRGIGVVERET